MVKLDKIYTRGGDKGLTSLGNGDRVKKNSKRILAYGQVDELNSSIGIVCCFCSFYTIAMVHLQFHVFFVAFDVHVGCILIGASTHIGAKRQLPLKLLQ